MQKDLLIDDIIFNSDNIFDIPLLDINKQSKNLIAPYQKWGQKARKENGYIGTYHFYTDDYKFNAVWNDPFKLINNNPNSICEINYSLSELTPLAHGLSLIYKKRFISRLCQDNGINIIVDLYVPIKYDKYNLLGVPKGWRAYSTRGVASDFERLKEQYDIAINHAGTKDILFIIFGGGEKAKQFSLLNKCIYINLSYKGL
jgi:hypothetical protein